jgi:ubiquinone/menaquinone biosynthesis C-methylase UbiE
MHRFNPEMRHRLLSEERYRTMPPDAILDRLPLRPDQTVADVGCGPGFFTLPLAARLPQGTVHAIDVEPAMLAAVQERAGEAGLTNILPRLAEDQAIPLPPASLDGIFLALVYHEFPDRRAYLAMLAGLARPGSWLAFIEWDTRPNPGGGPPLDIRIGPDDAARELAAAGWEVTGRHPVGEWMYLLVASRQPEGM